jgi:hypothetical protein
MFICRKAKRRGKKAAEAREIRKKPSSGDKLFT